MKWTKGPTLRGKDGLDAPVFDPIPGPPGPPGRDGKDSDIPGPPGRDGVDGKDGKDGSPDTAEQVRDKLASLGGDERLDYTSIKGLENLVKTIKGKTQEFIVGGIRYLKDLADARISSPTNGQVLTYDSTLKVWKNADATGGGGGGVTDHGALTGLADDDHPQYHNDTRGDARYSQLGHTHTASQVTDFDTEVSNNTDVAANTAARHTHPNSAALNATTASFTTADETKLDYISVTQAVDLDTIESDTATNNAKVSNATHTGDVTGSTALTLDKTAITGKTLVTAAGTDYILVSQTSDSGNLHKALASDLIGSGWGLTGNSGTTPGTNYIGTSDNQDVIIKRNNVNQLKITGGGDNFILGSGAAHVYGAGTILNIGHDTSSSATLSIGTDNGYTGSARTVNIGPGTGVNTVNFGGNASPSASNAFNITAGAGLNLKPYGSAAGNTTTLRFTELAANGTNYVALKAPDSLATNTTYVLPSTDPTAGQLLSATAPSTGVVTTSWVTPSTLTDGDKGDITVSGSGATWTIDAGAVSLSKQADVATSTVFYRKTAGTGAPEVQTLSTLKTDLGLTGTNSGDQTITLTGDVTGSGTGSFATTIGALKVLGSMIANATIDLATKVTGTLPVGNGGTGITSGTSGGVPYYSSSSTIASSAALTANAVIKGGGAGAAPTASGVSIDSSNNVTGLNSLALPTIPNQGFANILNLGLSVTVAANAMTVALKGNNGSDPSSTNVVSIAIPNFSTTSAASTWRSVTGALSVVIPSATTIGTKNALLSPIYIYAIDNAGTIELAVSLKDFGPAGTVTTSAISGGATSTTMYSTTARTSVGYRQLGVAYSNQTTAGTWAASPTSVQIAPLNLKTYWFRADLSGNQTGWTSGGSPQRVNLNSESFDPDNVFDSTTNYRFDVQEPGTYLFQGSGAPYGSIGATFYVYKNGSISITMASYIAGSVGTSSGGGPISLVPGDYVQLYGYQASGSTDAIYGVTGYTWLSGRIIR